MKRLLTTAEVFAAMGEVLHTNPFGLTPEQIAQANMPEVREGDWQPIETAPQDGTEILIYCPCELGSRMAVVYSSVTNAWSDGIDIYEPSHWMNLPDAPA